MSEDNNETIDWIMRLLKVQKDSIEYLQQTISEIVAIIGDHTSLIRILKQDMNDTFLSNLLFITTLSKDGMLYD